MDIVNEPSSLQGSKYEYEVFLSCSRDEVIRTSFSSCGSLICKAISEDTQESFPFRLYSSLRKARISVLKDDISIEGSKISIIIFSEQYGSSKKCLEELFKIMEFYKSHHHQVVLPIFYGVTPSEVCIQKHSFGRAFLGLVQRISPTKDEVTRWRRALKKAGNIDGFVMANLEPSNESEFIQNIVEHVRHILSSMLAKEDVLLGVGPQVEEVIKMLHEHESKDVVSIGIWGMGGIGKSTLARLIFDRIRWKFKRTYFVSNVADKLKNLDSIINEAKKMRKDNHNKKVLVVLDDVNDLEQLHALRGSRGSFGRGSRIIITTRDLYMLQLFQVDDAYTMKLLSHHDSLQLFTSYAFEQANPDKGQFMELCRRVVAYTEGLPLALQVVGSFFYKRSLTEWESALMKLSTDLPPKIYNTLKLSFDPLDGNEKEVFMNIVLFYIGEDINDVIQKLAGRGCNASKRIRVLVDRSLVTIDNNRKLQMHNLLRLMGRKIIRETSQKEFQNRGHRYEVFLSFRGEDTRSTFTSHLYRALHNAGIIVFKDDVELPIGNYIKTELLQAIGSSKLSIIIFSREYAASKWCLEELSMIMDLRKSNDHVVLPVFFDVDPSEIRHQTSSFGKAFKDLTKRISSAEDQVSKWRTTLTEAGGIAGIVVLGSRDESEKVKEVVGTVCDILDKKYLFVADHPVGVDDRVQAVIKMIRNQQSEDVVMVGIWGMGGIGKTTFAKAIYNTIGRKFENKCYLSKIRKVRDQKEGQVHLQNQLLYEICKTTEMKIKNIDSGKITLSNRLHHKRALVVLDDVDKLAQLNALVGSRDWFKLGSVIIITTRNQRLLLQKDCSIYRMKHLDEMESIELLSWHAFKQANLKEGFAQLSRDIVAYSAGLPLALEVLGSYLFGRETKEWKSVLEKLRKIPNDKIQKKLKISFDGLDDFEKEIFLDISCFFIGMDKNDASQILNSCGFFADIGIKTLVERSLVTIDEKNKLGMHDLLRDMGREIIRKQSERELGKRSRLWYDEDARAVLLKRKGTEAIEGLSLDLSQSEKMYFQTVAFKKMKRLRLLHLDNVQLRGDYKYLSRDLKWLCWHGFPLKCIPSNFYHEESVVIDLKYSNLIKVWKESQLLKRLKILNLSHSLYLVQTPDFSYLPNLEKLILKDCPSLSTIHHSIGLLRKLLLLDLEDCTRLCSLPRSVYRLKCLITLILSGCVKIEKLEKDIVQMESLTNLIAPTIRQVPFSIVRLKRILYLSVCGHEGSSHRVIPSLFQSWISPTNNPLPHIPTHVGMPSSILWKMLNRICGRPSTFTCISEPKQQNLLLENRLMIPDSFRATNCVDTSRLEDCLGHCLVQIGKDAQVFCTLSERVSQGLNLTDNSDECILPGDNYPYWLTFEGEGASVKFEVPPINGHAQLKGMTICGVYVSSSDLGNKACESYIRCLMIINYTKTTTLAYMEDKLNSLEEVERNEIISNLESNDQVEVKAFFGSGFTVKKMVVYLIYNESFGEQMKPSPSATKHKFEE